MKPQPAKFHRRHIAIPLAWVSARILPDSAFPP